MDRRDLEFRRPADLSLLGRDAEASGGQEKTRTTEQRISPKLMTPRIEPVTPPTTPAPSGPRHYTPRQEDRHEGQKQGVRTKFDPKPPGHSDIIEPKAYRFFYKTKKDPSRLGDVLRTDPVWLYAFMIEGAGWGVGEVCDFLKKHNVGCHMPIAYDQNKPAVSFGEMIKEFYDADYKTFQNTNDGRWSYEGMIILLDHIWMAGELMMKLLETGCLDSNEAKTEIWARYTGSRKNIPGRFLFESKEVGRQEEEGDGDSRGLIEDDTEKEVTKDERGADGGQEEGANDEGNRGTGASAKRPAPSDTDEDDDVEENEEFWAMSQERLETNEKEVLELGSDEEDEEGEERKRRGWGTEKWKAANKNLRQKIKKNQEFAVGILRDNRTLVRRLGGYVARDRRDASKDMQKTLETHLGGFMRETLNNLATLTGIVNGMRKQLDEVINCSRQKTGGAGSGTSNETNIGNEGQGLMRSQSHGDMMRHTWQMGGGLPGMARAMGGQGGGASTDGGHQPGWANQGAGRT